MAKKANGTPAKPAVIPDARPPVILFGIPSRGKIPVAARFAPHEIEVARWIAKHEVNRPGFAGGQFA